MLLHHLRCFDYDSGKMIRHTSSRTIMINLSVDTRPTLCSLDVSPNPRPLDMITHLRTQPKHDRRPQTLPHLTIMVSLDRFTLHQSIHLFRIHPYKILFQAAGLEDGFVLLFVNNSCRSREEAPAICST